MFDHNSKHLKVLLKYSAVCPIFNSLLRVWKRAQTRSFLFDILHQNVDTVTAYKFSLLFGMKLSGFPFH